uniref:Nuclear receptor domain-containing protein n=1 Tax=Rhabditophanes sp. KR3021 TaxID=114890 RepID=A0AC35TN66_9BILA
MKQRYLAVLFLTLALLSKVYADHEDIEDPQDHKHLEDPQTESEDAITSEPDTNCVDSMKHLCPGNLTWHNAAITENYCPMIKIKSNSNSYKSSGCFCCSPYVRDFSNNCILRCDCVTSTPPPVCVKPNEVYLTLPIDEKKCPHNGASMHTSTNKGAGCFCPKSFARDSRGNCIPECECSGSPDDIYGNCCGNLTWSNKFISESWCAEQLPPIAPSHRRPGCYCCAGYSRNKYGICVENCDCDPPNVITTMPPVSGTTKCPTIPITGTTQCPTTITITNKPTTHCKQTEIFLECGPFEKTCSNFKKELQTSNECRKAGCYCRDGYVRSRYGHCIKPQECATCTIIEKPQLPKDCFQNYTWLRKGAPEYFCDNRLVCDLDHLNSKACFCVNGFVLTDSGKCSMDFDHTNVSKKHYSEKAQSSNKHVRINNDSDRSASCGCCGADGASGFHFGSNYPVCSACVAAFRRSVVDGRTYKCRHNNNCLITVFTRNSCRACRMASCLKIGMKTEYVQSNRDLIGSYNKKTSIPLPNITSSDSIHKSNSVESFHCFPSSSHSNSCCRQSQSSTIGRLSPNASITTEKIFENAVYAYKRKVEQRKVIHCDVTFKNLTLSAEPKLREISYGEHVKPGAYKVEVGTFILFLNDIKAFNGFSEEDRTLLFKNICIYSHFSEKHYRSMKQDGLKRQYVIFSDFTYIDLNKMDEENFKFYDDTPNDTTKIFERTRFDNVKKMLFESVKSSFNTIVNSMQESNMNDAEYCGLFFLMLYSCGKLN